MDNTGRLRFHTGHKYIKKPLWEQTKVKIQIGCWNNKCLNY